jgi:hypothetical protein
MGCSKSKPIAKDKEIRDGPVTEEELSKMNRAERFELLLPLQRTDVETYCKCIKNA